LINWEFFENKRGSYYKGNYGQPETPIRLMVGLNYLQHAFGFSDEAVMSK